MPRWSAKRCEQGHTFTTAECGHCRLERQHAIERAAEEHMQRFLARIPAEMRISVTQGRDIVYRLPKMQRRRR